MSMNPRMLVLAREAQELTQEELAGRTGLAQSVISKAEKGGRLLHDADLPLVARVLRVTPEMLCWTDQVYGFGTASFFHRKQQSLSQKTLRRIQAEVNLLSMRLVRLSSGIEVDTPLSIPRMDIDEFGSPEEIARRLRAAWRLPMGPVLSLVGAMEAAGGTVVLWDFGTHRLEAISVWHPSHGPLFVLNENLRPERQRFVLGHELGHMIMHEGAPPRDNAEREADRFAEELLMPAAEISGDLYGIDLRKAMALKPYWRVPIQSLILRAEHLDIIDHARSRSLHAYMNKLGFLTSEPLPLEPQEPEVLREMVRIHLHDHAYSYSELAAMLGMIEEDLIAPSAWERGGLRIVR